MKPKALDIFCGAGGATKGLQNAGFYVVGVDKNPQPQYCGDAFIQADALELFPQHLQIADFVWASPPCQAYTAQGKIGHPKLIEPIRALLRDSNVPYCIENVMGAPLINPAILCGSMFGLGVRRHRKFETSFNVHVSLACKHDGQDIRAYYGAPGREAFRAKKPGNKDVLRGDTERAPKDMGIDWMDWKPLTQAIPPAYAEYIGHAALKHIRQCRAA